MFNPWALLTLIIAFVLNGFYWNAHGSNAEHARMVAKLESERAQALQKARDKGLTRIELTVRENNARAVDLYKKLKEVDQLKDDFISMASHELRTPLAQLKFATQGKPLVLITHNMGVVSEMAQRVAVMYAGQLMEQRSVNDLFATPLHPYTEALLSAVPVPDPVVEDRRQRIVLQGDLPSPANPPSGCRFRTRCPYAQLHCAEEVPELRELRPGHLVACHYADDLTAVGAPPR